LVTAVVTAKLDTVLSQPGPFTVFAPSNSAFAALCKTLNKTLEQVLQLPNLKDILEYHVVPSKILSSDLKASQSVPTLQGAVLVVNSTNGTVTVNGAKVIKADVTASNGVIHIIDAVLIPLTPAQSSSPTPSPIDRLVAFNVSQGRVSASTCKSTRLDILLATALSFLVAFVRYST